MLTQTSIEELKAIPLFRDLTEDELRYLAREMELREYKKGEFVYQEGDIPGILYVIQQGAVEITKKTPTGHRQVIAMILGMLGISSLLGLPFMLTAERHVGIHRGLRIAAGAACVVYGIWITFSVGIGQGLLQ